jgi:hypothetical protein
VVTRFKATLVAPRWLFLRLKPSSIAIFYLISSTTPFRETQSNTVVLQKTKLTELGFAHASIFRPLMGADGR